MGKLVLFLADGTTLDIPLERDRVSIGRGAANDVCLPYPPVSGEHAVVVPVTAGAVIEDLGSTNGTFVNGKRVPRQFLHDGDRIDIGRQKLVYLSAMNAVAKPPARDLPLGETDVTDSDDPTRLADAVADCASLASSSNEAAQSSRAPMIDASDESEPIALFGPMLSVVTGPNAGRRLVLTKEETIVGRVGVQVVAVHKVEEGFRLLAIEGAEPPKVNGLPLPADGQILKSGDAIDLALAQLEFSAADPPHG
jgi:pSer/pThr/pTyr-binding forkhead associated (FHA) protein